MGIHFCRCLFGLMLLSACAWPTRADTLAPVVPALPAATDTIAIGIAIDLPEARLDCPDGTLAWNADGTFYLVSGGRLDLRPDSGGVTWFFDSTTPGPSSARWRFRAPDSAPLCVGGTPYRGDLVVRAARAANTDSEARGLFLLTGINILPLEEYLRGVVPREIGTGRPTDFEAIKAQAVAARTYAVSNRGRRGDLGFDLFATTADQVYGGVAAETPLGDSAVLATRGEILVYDGRPIEALYHSTCGGRTTSRRDAWGGPDVPYLVSVEDRLGDTFACAGSRYFSWTEEYTSDTLTRLIGPSDSFTFQVLERDSGGRVRLLLVAGNDTAATWEGDAVRKGLRRPDGSALRSTWFEIAVDSDRFIVRGRGWGHGIGMCQTGAIGRARAGQDYRAILAVYYPGAVLVRLPEP